MSDLPAFEIQQGDSPVILAIPHTGDQIPAEIWDRFTDAGCQLIDTDWHVHQLYEGLLPNATVIRALFHRYVIDANRDPAGGALYQNRKESALCPLHTFDGQPIYQPGGEPDEAEVSERIERYHRPYHAAIEQELSRAMRTRGTAVLYDCHSIRSKVPRLFHGQLADLSIGTFDGSSCHRIFEDTVYRHCKESTHYSVELNHIFRGGWTTRYHGKPIHAVHAIQMELSQSTYMLEQEPWTMIPHKAERLRSLLADILLALEQAANAYLAAMMTTPGFAIKHS